MATLLYTLGALLLRPFLVVQPTRGMARASYVLLRSHLGRHHASFIGVVELFIVLVVVGVWLAVLRGITSETPLGGFFDIWITLPLTASLVAYLAWWGARKLGLVGEAIGPLHDDRAHSNFTGHQAPFWPRFGLLDEWNVLTRYEPLLITALGLFFLAFPFTRAAGVVLLAVAAASAFHSWRDWHVNHEEHDPSSSEESEEVVIPRTALKVEKSKVVQVPDGPSGGAPRVFSEAKFTPSDVTARGLRSAKFVFDFAGWVSLGTALLLTNLLLHDPAGIYTRAPELTVAASESIGRELAVLGLDERNTDGMYKLTASILQQHDPDAIATIRAERTQTVSDDVYERLSLAREQLEDERQRCLADLPGELTSPPGDARLHRLFLEDADAAADFATILNGLEDTERDLAELESAHAEAETGKATSTNAQVKRALREVDRQIPAIDDRIASVRSARQRLLELLNEN